MQEAIRFAPVGTNYSRKAFPVYYLTLYNTLVDIVRKPKKIKSKGKLKQSLIESNRLVA